MGLLIIQHTYQYRKQIQQCYSLYNQKDYAAAVQLYDHLLKYSNESSDYYIHYNAACCWALVGNKEQALEQLALAIKMGYSNLSHFQTDSDLQLLHQETWWETLVKMVEVNKIKADVIFMKAEAEVLESIYQMDQGDRRKIIDFQKKYGWNSKEEEKLWEIVNEHDFINLKLVKQILDHYGWLGPMEVGQKGTIALFLVIQHADYTTQKKYLPYLKRAVEEGKADIANLAYLEDRILTVEGKPQIYGTQLKRNSSGEYEFYRIEDPISVNERRNNVGLPPIEEYVRYYKIDYADHHSMNLK